MAATVKVLLLMKHIVEMMKAEIMGVHEHVAYRSIATSARNVALIATGSKRGKRPVAIKST
jgi:hypothetical protein